MASRYWVGGTAAWDITAGTKWATTSGGAGGAAAPTSADDVFLDGSSGSGTVTTSLFSTCKSLTTTGFTGTLAGSSAVQCSGSVTLDAGMTWSNTGGVSFNGVVGGTITTNGIDVRTISSFTATGTWALGDALSLSEGLAWISGSFATANFNVTAKYFNFQNATNVSLGSSTITATGIDGSNQAWSISSSVTLAAGTSTIKFTDSTASDKYFVGAGLTYNNLWFAPGAGTGGLVVSGANTFNDFKDDGSAAHTIQFPATLTQTVSSFTVNGSAGNLISMRSSSSGSQFTLSKSSGSVSRSYLDIKDSAATGGATWTAGVGSVNSGNNTGWIFPSFAGPPFNPLSAFAHLIVR